MPIALIVDDDESMREIATRCLEAMGFTVYCAEDGKEALKKYAAAVPDIIISDIMMPGQDGMQTIIALKKINPSVKIIAISGGGRMNVMDMLAIAKQLGAVSTLLKPFSLDELRLAVSTALKSEGDSTSKSKNPS